MGPVSPRASNPHTACCTHGSVNVAHMLAALAGPLLPGNLRAVVGNRSMPDTGVPAAGCRRERIREAEALIDAACCEMLGWGMAIGFSRMLALAEQVAPGVSFPWTTWQCFCALSDAARGNLLHALQGLPVGAVPPSVLRAAVEQALQGVVPPVPGSGGGHQDVVIGLACCAVLYEIGRQRPVEAVRSATGRVLLHRLRQLRAVLNIASGLQHSPVAAAAGDHPVAAASPHPGASSRLCWWKGHPDATHLPPPMAVSPRAGGDAVPGDSWLLPGAAARSGKGNATPAKKPAPPKPAPGTGARKSSLAKPASPGHRGRPAKGVVAGIGAAASGSVADPGAAAGSAAAGGSAGGAGGADANKEAMFAVLPGKKAKQLPTAPLYSDLPIAKPPALLPATPQAADVPDSGVVVRTASHAPTTAPHLLPSCVRFHHAGEAGRQVRKSRFDVPTPRFCVHDGARVLFESQFDIATDPGAHRDDWIVGLPIRERYANPLRQAGIKKYSGLGQLDKQAPHARVALGDDEIYVVASISLLPGHALQRHRPSAAQVLAPDAFRLIEHIQLDGRRRVFMAYVIQYCAGTVAAVHPGLVEIRQGPDGFRLDDPESGFTLHGDSLVSLVIGIERVSGWRFHPDADALQAMDAQGAAPVGTPASLSLFVRKDALSAAGPCVGRTGPQRRSQFFETVSFGEPEAGGRLMRNCFSVLDAMIVAVDPQGLLHTLVFTPVDGTAGVLRLNAQRGPGRGFLQSVGLRAGHPYALKEAGSILQGHGFSEVHGDARAPVPGATGFQVYRSSGTPRPSVGLPTSPLPGLRAEQDPAGTGHPVLSTFRIDDARIHYVDHDATTGVLMLVQHGRAPARWLLAADNPAAAMLFARSNGMQPGTPYTLEELTWLLYGNGFVQHAR